MGLKLFVEILQIVVFKVIEMIRTDHYIEDLVFFVKNQTLSKNQELKSSDIFDAPQKCKLFIFY